MAVSAASRLSNPQTFVIGNKRVSVTDVTMDSGYLSGGEGLSASSLGLRVVDFAICTVKSVGGTVNVAQVHYDPSTGLIHLFDETPAEVASTSDVSNIVVQVVAFGS